MFLLNFYFLFQKLLLTFGWSHMFRIGFFVCFILCILHSFSLYPSLSSHVVVVCFVCYICCCCLLPFVVICLSQLSSFSLYIHFCLSITCIYIYIIILLLFLMQFLLLLFFFSVSLSIVLLLLRVVVVVFFNTYVSIFRICVE